MALLLALLAALIPVVIAPGLLFYFDVTPKTILLLLGTGIAVVWWTGAGGVSGFHKASGSTRWFAIVLLGTAASLAVSTLTSTNPLLSLRGSNWRNWGLITQVAVLALAYLVAACCAGRPERLRIILRAIAAAGMITSLYGVAQYFGWDPLLDPKTYHVGEGIWMIVRPPSTLGHADYFGIWLLCGVFGGAALAYCETARAWKWLAWASAATGSVAIFLSGTRAAMLGLLAGAAILALWRGVRITRAVIAVAVLVLAASAVFYVSPAGARFRARVHWSLQEPAGGARLLLWRDTGRMVVSRWWLGYGPETFIGNFAKKQSVDLARAYPDFYHESPHNILLDAAAAQGLPGVALLAALCGVGFAAALNVHWNSRPGGDWNIAGALAASLAAMSIAGQFASFILSTAVPFYLLVAMLVSLTCRVRLKPRAVSWRWVGMAVAWPFAGLLIFSGVRLLLGETAMAEVRRDLDADKLGDVALQYSRFEHWRLPGASTDLWYSRRLAQIAESRADLVTRIQAAQECTLAAQRATHTAEDPFNAYYNLAEVHARQNDFAGTEQNLRAAISRAPNWFKPHWMLAQVLEADGRPREAEAEAVRAAFLDGGKHPEVARTLEQIRKQLAKK
jgi:O-antigen ligase